MTNKDRDRIVNYAIDNKVSLEEAQKHFIVKGREEKEEKFKEAYNEPDLDNDGDLQGFSPGYDDEVMTPEEGKAWARYQQIQKELAKLYDEYSSTGESLIKRQAEEVTQEELDWVEEQLRQIDNDPEL